jgi:uncharacterized protein YjbI with pentapeptide repeats
MKSTAGLLHRDAGFLEKGPRPRHDGHLSHPSPRFDNRALRQNVDGQIAYLQNVNFQIAYLQNVNFQIAYLQNVNFQIAYLQNIDFQSINIKMPASLISVP